MQHVDGGSVHVGPVGLSILSPQLLCNSKAILQFEKKILKIYDYWTHCLRLAFALCVKQQKGLRIIYFHFSLLPSV